MQSRAKIGFAEKFAYRFAATRLSFTLCWKRDELVLSMRKDAQLLLCVWQVVRLILSACAVAKLLLSMQKATELLLSVRKAAKLLLSYQQALTSTKEKPLACTLAKYKLGAFEFPVQKEKARAVSSAGLSGMPTL